MSTEWHIGIQQIHNLATKCNHTSRVKTMRWYITYLHIHMFNSAPTIQKIRKMHALPGFLFGSVQFCNLHYFELQPLSMEAPFWDNDNILRREEAWSLWEAYEVKFGLVEGWGERSSPPHPYPQSGILSFRQLPCATVLWLGFSLDPWSTLGP